MSIVSLPMHIKGVADLDTGDIIVSCFQSVSSLLDTIRHEFAHLIARDCGHSDLWERCYRRLGGQSHYHYRIFDRKFTNIGYIPNIGNISGVQNILF